VKWLKKENENEQRRSATRDVGEERKQPHKKITRSRGAAISDQAALERRKGIPGHDNEHSGHAPSDHFPLIAMVPETLFGLLQV
jgi:hypothetical protein